MLSYKSNNATALHLLPTLSFRCDWFVAIACVIEGIQQCWRWNQLPSTQLTLKQNKVYRPLPPGKARFRAASRSAQLNPWTAASRTSWMEAIGSRITLAPICCSRQSAPSTTTKWREAGLLLAWVERMISLTAGSTTFIRLRRDWK